MKRHLSGLCYQTGVFFLQNRGWLCRIKTAIFHSNPVLLPYKSVMDFFSPFWGGSPCLLYTSTGKSHLAKQLAAVFPAAIVHMDDFFLQSFQRTPKRLAEPGGNLDYERFAAQVVPSLKTKAAFSYEIFDCSCGKDVYKRQPVGPA